MGGKVVYTGKPEVAELSEFVHMNSIPLVIDFSYDFAPIIFSGSIKNHVLLFASTKAGNYAEIKDALTKLAKIFKVPETEHPALRIVKLGEYMQRFKSQDLVLDEENIKAFIEKYLAGELKPELLSEDIPEDWDHKPVKVLVGKNFNEVVNSTEKNTLVMFYAHWCGHCKKLEPLWEELAEKYKEAKDVTIAKIDATKNELEHIRIRAFPTVKLFLKQIDNAKDYNGERTVDGLVRFIESNGMDGGAVDIDDDSYDHEDDEEVH